VVFLDVRTGEFLQLWTPSSPTADRLRPYLNRKSNAEEGNEKKLVDSRSLFHHFLKAMLTIMLINSNTLSVTLAVSQ